MSDAVKVVKKPGKTVSKEKVGKIKPKSIFKEFLEKFKTQIMAVIISTLIASSWAMISTMISLPKKVENLVNITNSLKEQNLKYYNDTNIILGEVNQRLKSLEIENAKLQTMVNILSEDVNDLQKRRPSR